jgi:hypothetical protein
VDCDWTLKTSTKYKNVNKSKLSKKTKKLKMFFPEPKYQGGSVFNPSSYDCNNCCGGGDGAQGTTGPAGPAAPVVPSVAFSVAVLTNQALPALTNTIIAFDSEIYDTNSFFNPTAVTVGGIPAYSFKPTIEGYYQFNATVNTDTINGAHDTIVSLFKNGVLYKRGMQLNSYPVSAAISANVSVSMYLNGSTDYVSIAAYLSVAGFVAGSSNPALTHFDGFLTANGQVGATGPVGPAGGGDVYLAAANTFTNTNTFQTIVPSNNTFLNGTSTSPWGGLWALGVACRNGIAGIFSGNRYNINWTGSQAELWIDATNLGNITLQTYPAYGSSGNSGSAGGQYVFYSVGAIKTCTGTTASIAVPAATGGFIRTIDFPAGYFASIQSFTFSAVTNSSTTDKADIRCVSFPGVASASLQIYSGVGTNMVVSWTAIGL